MKEILDIDSLILHYIEKEMLEPLMEMKLRRHLKLTEIDIQTGLGHLENLDMNNLFYQQNMFKSRRLCYDILNICIYHLFAVCNFTRAISI